MTENWNLLIERVKPNEGSWASKKWHEVCVCVPEKGVRKISNYLKEN